MNSSPITGVERCGLRWPIVLMVSVIAKMFFWGRGNNPNYCGGSGKSLFQNQRGSNPILSFRFIVDAPRLRTVWVAFCSALFRDSSLVFGMQELTGCLILAPAPAPPMAAHTLSGILVNKCACFIDCFNHETWWWYCWCTIRAKDDKVGSLKANPHIDDGATLLMINGGANYCNFCVFLDVWWRRLRSTHHIQRNTQMELGTNLAFLWRKWCQLHGCAIIFAPICLFLWGEFHGIFWQQLWVG